jgi:hypothetical protein
MSVPNPAHFQVALNEANVQLQLLSSRAQQLAVELHEERQLRAALKQELAELRSKSNGADPKLGSAQRNE